MKEIWTTSVNVALTVPGDYSLYQAMIIRLCFLPSPPSEHSPWASLSEQPPRPGSWRLEVTQGLPAGGGGGTERGHTGPGAGGAAAKISSELQGGPVRQDPEPGPSPDHFTQQIMYFSQGSPSRGLHTMLLFSTRGWCDLFVRSRQEFTTKEGYSL